VRDILDALGQRDDVRSYLLTGNTRRGAQAKLSHYDLLKYFPDGAFAEDQGVRASIATRALELARRSGPVVDEQIFVIGDTPHDIEAAAAIQARTIAVATGGYSVEELSAHQPWRVFEQLPPPDAFLDLIGLRRQAAEPYSASDSRTGTEKTGARR
jgi:phosphoglycolate phosphatase-like HAD superfamily hydrolase